MNSISDEEIDHKRTGYDRKSSPVILRSDLLAMGTHLGLRHPYHRGDSRNGTERFPSLRMPSIVPSCMEPFLVGRQGFCACARIGRGTNKSQPLSRDRLRPKAVTRAVPRFRAPLPHTAGSPRNRILASSKYKI